MNERIRVWPGTSLISIVERLGDQPQSLCWVISALAIFVLGVAGCGGRSQDERSASDDLRQESVSRIDSFAPDPPAAASATADADPPPSEEPDVRPDATSLAPQGSPQKLREQTMAALESRDIDLADRLIREAIEVDPKEPDSVYLMALVLSEQNRFPEAVRMLDQLAASHPQLRLPTLGQTAEWRVIEGRWEDAESRFRTVLAETGRVGPAHRMLARLLIRQGRRFEAAGLIRQLARGGDVEEVELRTLLSVGTPFAADAALEEMEPIGPMGESIAASASGDPDLAMSILASAETRSAAAEARWGRLMAEQGDAEALQDWVSRWRQTDRSSESIISDAQYAIGAWESGRGNHAAAALAYGDAIVGNPTDAAAYDALSREVAQINEYPDQARVTTELADRATAIRATQRIGNAMAESPVRDPNQLAELTAALDKLRRPFESVAWRALVLMYSGRQMPRSQVQQQLNALNRERLQALKSATIEPDRDFLLAGIDADTLTTIAAAQAEQNATSNSDASTSAERATEEPVAAESVGS